MRENSAAEIVTVETIRDRARATARPNEWNKWISAISSLTTATNHYYIIIAFHDIKVFCCCCCWRCLRICVPNVRAIDLSEKWLLLLLLYIFFLFFITFHFVWMRVCVCARVNYMEKIEAFVGTRGFTNEQFNNHHVCVCVCVLRWERAVKNACQLKTNRIFQRQMSELNANANKKLSHWIAYKHINLVLKVSIHSNSHAEARDPISHMCKMYYMY